MFERPQGTLSYAVGSVMNFDASGEFESISPHKDAPKFFQFAEAAKKLVNPQSLFVSQSYLGNGRSEISLFGGTVSIPRDLQLNIKTEKEARNLVELLIKYAQSNCA